MTRSGYPWRRRRPPQRNPGGSGLNFRRSTGEFYKREYGGDTCCHERVHFLVIKIIPMPKMLLIKCMLLFIIPVPLVVCAISFSAYVYFCRIVLKYRSCFWQPMQFTLVVLLLLLYIYMLTVSMCYDGPVNTLHKDEREITGALFVLAHDTS